MQLKYPDFYQGSISASLLNKTEKNIGTQRIFEVVYETGTDYMHSRTSQQIGENFNEKNNCQTSQHRRAVKK